MSMLLTKRLARSLWRTKIRLVAVVMMVTMGVFAGATMAGYASNIQTMYDTIYEDTNLGDLWFDNRTSTWTAEETDSLCSAFSSGGYTTESIVACEGRLVMRGTTLHEASTIDSLWTSMDPNASVDTLWFPSSGCCDGHPALEPNEVVLSTHVNALDEQGARALPFELGDSVLLGAEGEATYEIVGIALHHENILNAPEGSILPPKAGTYIVGWMSHEGLARISGVPNGSTNLIILDVEGTPSYDLPDTPEDEGAGIAPHADHVKESADALGIEGRVRDRGSHATVELLRADVEANEDFVLPVTVMIAIIASITIVISLQRLVQSQAREIAILRTLGIPRTSLMRGYLLAPIVIGAIGSLLGAILGLLGMNGLLDFYETFVNVPITSRPYPMASVLGIVGATMIVVVLAGVLPARRAMRLDPLETLSGRNEVRVGSAVLQRLTAWMPTSNRSLGQVDVPSSCPIGTDVPRHRGVDDALRWDPDDDQWDPDRLRRWRDGGPGLGPSGLLHTGEWLRCPRMGRGCWSSSRARAGTPCWQPRGRRHRAVLLRHGPRVDGGFGHAHGSSLGRSASGGGIVPVGGGLR